MTDAQKVEVKELLRGALEAHHGDCVGADDEFHAIARELDLRVVIHPPEVQAYRAWNTGDVHAREKDYLARNRDIVHACDYVIATPKSMEDQSGGTWYTIRYAIKTGRSVVLVRPDGSSLWEVGTQRAPERDLLADLERSLGPKLDCDTDRGQD